MGFGNAGVHLPHANAYPIAGRVRDFHPKDYPADEAMVPHGMSVALTAPEVFRFTFDAAPERHVRAAELLGPGATRPADDREFLPTVITDLLRDIDIPNGIGAVGFGESDIPDLVDGTMKQQRLLATCPRTPTEDDIADIFAKSISNW
jgi:alcohol dehydrogenase class IV